ncbi:hypothetical protein ACOSQ3_031476 [Xanthoceras sorbifolium]
MFGSTCTLIEKLSNVGLNGNIRGEALGVSDVLCCALQMNSQDILNVLNLVSTIKLLLQQHDIDTPNMGERYMEGTRRSCQQKNNITMEHYYHFNIFNTVIDFHLMELNNRFTEKTVKFLTLS